MADTRFELRLRTCPWCGQEVQEETYEDRRTRQWVPWTDYLHHHTLEQVTAYGAYLRGLLAREEADTEAAAQQSRLDGILRTAVEQQRLERRRQRAALRPRPPPPIPPSEYGNETL